MEALRHFSDSFSHAMTYLVTKYVSFQIVEFVAEDELEAIADASNAWQALSAWDQQVVAYAQVDVFIRMAWQTLPGDSDEEYQAVAGAVLEIFSAVQEFTSVVDTDDEEDSDEAVFEFTAEKEHLAACFAL